MLFEECALKRDFTELRCFDMVAIAEAACYYMVHTLKPLHTELSISRHERESIFNDETLNKSCCVCPKGLELEATHRKFPLFYGNTISHNQHTTFPPMKRDYVKWWLWKQLTTVDFSRLTFDARRWMIETLFAPARLYFILKTMEESYELENVQNGNVLEVLCMNIDKVWSLLKHLFEKVIDKALPMIKTNLTA